MKPDVAAAVSVLTGSCEQNVEVCGLGSGGVALEVLAVVGGIGGDDVNIAGDTVVRDLGDVGWSAVADGVDEFELVVLDGGSVEVVLEVETCVAGLDCSYNFLASNARRICPPEKQLVRTTC